jgi:hypothetical protein
MYEYEFSDWSGIRIIDGALTIHQNGGERASTIPFGIDWPALVLCSIPWMVSWTAAIGAAWFGLRVIRTRKVRARVSAGSCPQCSYQLVAGACPECGWNQSAVPRPKGA